MRLTSVVSLLILIIFTSNVTAQKQNFAAGRVLMKVVTAGTAARGASWQPTSDSQAFAASARTAVGATLIERFPSTGWELVQLPAKVSPMRATEAFRTAAQRLRTSGQFASAQFEVITEPDYHILIPREPEDAGNADVAAQGADVSAAALEPNDPSYPRQGRYKTLKAPDAWALTQGDHGVVVAIVDTGVDYTHQDLDANVWRGPGGVRGYDACTGDSNPMPPAGSHHGTHVAGIVGQVGNNSIGGVGVNWRVTLLPVRFLCGQQSANSEQITTVSRMMSAYEFIIAQRQNGLNIRAVNNSWINVPASNYIESQKQTIDAAGELGILNVFAAGNFGGRDNDANPVYPASYPSPSVIAVAASDADDKRASFTAAGKTSVDVAAPGVGLLSTYIGNQYGGMSGTSMASPVVAGAVALASARNRNATAADLKAKLIATCDPLSTWQNLVVCGGRVNLAAYVTAIGDGGGDTSPDRGVLFTSTREGLRQVYRMNADGTGIARLTSNGSNYSARWTPDRKRVLFVSNRDGQPEIYSMNPDGTDQRRLTTGGENTDPSP